MYFAYTFFERRAEAGRLGRIAGGGSSTKSSSSEPVRFLLLERVTISREVMGSLTGCDVGHVWCTAVLQYCSSAVLRATGSALPQQQQQPAGLRAVGEPFWFEIRGEGVEQRK